MHITIHTDRAAGRLSPFWASMGFTPATLLMTDDMRQQITYLGSIPRGGVRYARIHFLLELVDADFTNPAAPRYDMSRLVNGLDLLLRNGQRPVFELMGNPNGQFTDFNDPQQLANWRALTRDVLFYLARRYGPDELSRWYFEAWNEPDAGWWPQWPHDTASFNNYYDACAAGLEDAEAAAGLRLALGGPGTCRTLSPLFQAFAAHAGTGANHLTGRPVRVDFISVHEKGVRAHKEDLNPRTAALIEREIEAVRYLRQQHPRLAALPFMNNECDPQVGWKDHHTWHARPYYAAWVIKSAALHLERMVDPLGVDYALLSNDNGFIGEWGHRTLLARFGPAQWIEDGQRGHLMLKGYEQRDMPTPPFAMVKKPVFNALTMLSYLGDERLAVERSGTLDDPAPDADLGVMAARAADGSLAVLVYYSRDRIMSSGKQRVTVTLRGLPFARARLAHYRIDEDRGDPYALWEAAGAPASPTPDLLEAMRARQELELLEAPRGVEPQDGQLDLSFDLPLHAASLLLLLPEPAQPQALEITGLRAEPFAGLYGDGEWLLRWNPLPTRALRTYQVLRADSPAGPFAPLAAPDLLCAAWLVTRPGAYQVRAVDHWGRPGPVSEMIFVK